MADDVGSQMLQNNEQKAHFGNYPILVLSPASVEGLQLLSSAAEQHGLWRGSNLMGPTCANKSPQAGAVYQGGGNAL